MAHPSSEPPVTLLHLVESHQRTLSSPNSRGHSSPQRKDGASFLCADTLQIPKRWESAGGRKIFHWSKSYGHLGAWRCISAQLVLLLPLS